MQSDLFNVSMSNSFDRQDFRQSFFERKYTLRFDHLLGLGIVLIIFFVLVFAWGAEHGKAVSHREIARNAMLPVAPVALAPEPTSIVAAAPTPVVLEKNTPQVDSITPDGVKVIPAYTEVIELDVPATVNAPSELSSAVKPINSAPTAAISPEAKYTIAHVTYFKQSQADAEMKRLEGKGYTPILVSSGKYYQICVNGYKTRKSANEALKDLKAKKIISSDSYIRNMPVR